MQQGLVLEGGIAEDGLGPGVVVDAGPGAEQRRGQQESLAFQVQVVVDVGRHPHFQDGRIPTDRPWAHLGEHGFYASVQEMARAHGAVGDEVLGESRPDGLEQGVVQIGESSVKAFS
ncbi:hypothetical protein [Actinomadura sp. J1-007]|uniref:hypothetical protein n=1 Tax=Actinomadura sp. J1-007 TaxID=2661913 RepID=UPI001F503C30|nr:hypothetical protein [Actinomadura sp. J1-007]